MVLNDQFQTKWQLSEYFFIKKENLKYNVK